MVFAFIFSDLLHSVWQTLRPSTSLQITQFRFFLWLYSAAFGWNALWISLKFIWSNISFKDCVSLLIFCLDDLSIDESRVLKSPTIIVLLSISPFMTVSICLIYWGAPFLGAYIFIIVISPSWIDPFYHMQCPSLSLVTVFIFKPILSDMIIAIPAFFWLPFVWNTFFHPLSLSLYVSLNQKWVLWR